MLTNVSGGLITGGLGLPAIRSLTMHFHLFVVTITPPTPLPSYGSGGGTTSAPRQRTYAMPLPVKQKNYDHYLVTIKYNDKERHFAMKPSVGKIAVKTFTALSSKVAALKTRLRCLFKWKNNEDN